MRARGSPGRFKEFPYGADSKTAALVVEYLIDLNATQAAIRAGYSVKRAREYAYQLMQRPDIADAIAKAIAERAEKTKITQEQVLARYWMIATADGKEKSWWGEGYIGVCQKPYQFSCWNKGDPNQPFPSDARQIPFRELA